MIETNKQIIYGKFAKVLLFILILAFCNIGTKYPASSESSSIIQTIKIKQIPDVNYPMVVRERLHKELVIEVKKYITNMAPTSKVNADTLVNVCQRYDMDITFVLAQGLIESHFGTRGRAVGNPSKKIPPTNSVFNMGSWDSGKIIYKYKNVNASIEPFVRLVKSDYLSKRTLAQLLHDGGYKNTNGHRYASSPIYEQALRSTISTITMETSIKTYQSIISMSDANILSYFGPATLENGINSGTLTANLK